MKGTVLLPSKVVDGWRDYFDFHSVLSHCLLVNRSATWPVKTCSMTQTTPFIPELFWQILNNSRKKGQLKVNVCMCVH